ncbi:hypothetical protein LOD99_5900 [Oopsacas minuta]|uniref:Uncharacterized protein n=1 Tax=Oopsacas minuta TaxID=111878 RepID=A0AAV7JNN3_9METZ|nr:hypothetical protein LOD99_5900 [Oopsacas minuta]
MCKLLTLTFCLFLSVILTNTNPTCNDRILLGKPQAIVLTAGVEIKEVAGENQSIPLFNSNKVFIFTISHGSNNEITYNLDEEYIINAIGIRQRFDGKEYAKICHSSLSEDYSASYKVTYTNSASTTSYPIEYPIGTDLGIIVPSTLLPYQKIQSDTIDKETLKIALKPEKMTTITISKETLSIDNSIFNTGVYCLQFELYGCKASQYVEEYQILEYEMRQPSRNPFRSTDTHTDSEYTGLCSENYCTGGIGKLVDKYIVVTTNTPDLFVMWQLNDTGNNRNIMVANKTISIVKILINFDDVYFFDTIIIYGARNIRDKDFQAPIFMAVNGIVIDTSTVIEIGEFYIEVHEEAPWIALSEITFSITNESIVECATEQTSFTGLISVSAIAALLLLVLTFSIGLNIFLLTKKMWQKCDKDVKFRNPMRQTSEINEYRSSRQYFDEQYPELPNSTYESINDYHAKAPPIPSPTSRSSVTRLDAAISVIEMPTNPTYISTLPVTMEQELPGYSHLKFTKPTQPEIEENAQVIEGVNNTLPRMRESNDKMFTAAQRRASFVDQHLLSDLK